MIVKKAHRVFKRTVLRSRSNPRFLYFLILITAVVWVSGTLISPYKVHNKFMFATGFPGAVDTWIPEAPDYSLVTDTAAQLRAHPSITIKLVKDCPSGSERLTASEYKVSATGTLIETGSIPNSTAVVGFWFLGNDNSIVEYHNIHIQPGRYDTFSSHKVVSWPTAAVACVFGLISNVGGPTISVTDGSVDAVSANPVYKSALVAMGLLVLIFVLDVLYFAVRKLSVLQFLLPLVLVVSLVVGIALNGPLLVKYIHPILNWGMVLLSSMVGGVGENRMALAWIFKLGHGVLFFIISLCFFSIRMVLHTNHRIMLLSLLVLAVASEGLQLHINDRGASFIDILFDWAGVLAAWALCLAFRKKKNGTNNSCAV